jgi:hypothetical protein
MKKRNLILFFVEVFSACLIHLYYIHTYREKERGRKKKTFPSQASKMAPVVVLFIKISEYANMTKFSSAHLFYLFLLWSLVHASKVWLNTSSSLWRYLYSCTIFITVITTFTTVITLINRLQMFSDNFQVSHLVVFVQYYSNVSVDHNFSFLIL